MVDWSIAVPSFLTALVEWVEAFTIVLAVSLGIGWRGAIGAALAGLATLAALTAVSGGLLATGIDLGLVQLVIGVFLMLFGVRWLAKAIARYAGLKPLHDEAVEFEQTRAKLSGDWWAAWTVAFKGVMLEGLEVWLVVVALGMRSPGGAGLVSSIGAALAALGLTCLAGAAVRAPLQRVPENTIKFAVGAMIVSFGTYWTMEGVGGAAIWPHSDWTFSCWVPSTSLQASPSGPSCAGRSSSASSANRCCWCRPRRWPGLPGWRPGEVEACHRRHVWRALPCLS